MVTEIAEKEEDANYQSVTMNTEFYTCFVTTDRTQYLQGPMKSQGGWSHPDEDSMFIQWKASLEY
jgi:hypothetical protein